MPPALPAPAAVPAPAPASALAPVPAIAPATIVAEKPAPLPEIPVAPVAVEADGVSAMQTDIDQGPKLAQPAVSPAPVTPAGKKRKAATAPASTALTPPEKLPSPVGLASGRRGKAASVDKVGTPHN